MRRREFFGVVGGATAWPLAARAQQTGKVLRIGAVSGLPRSSPLWTAFDRRIAELGHQEGRNLATEHIQAENVEGFEFGYRELAKRQVDIVVASGPEIALKSALAATTTSPIVMIAIDYDPLARGYVTNLARPTGNVTGLFLRQIELVVKRLQVVKDAFPNIQRATVLWDRISADQWDAAQGSANQAGAAPHRHRAARATLRLRACARRGAGGIAEVCLRWRRRSSFAIASSSLRPPCETAACQWYSSARW